MLNIGVLVYFPHLKRVEFIYPEKLIRLRFAYPNAPEKTIKAYYKSFSDRISQINKQPDIFAGYELDQSLREFIDKELLPRDSSALQFGNTKKSILYTNSVSKILDDLYNLYFTVFEHNSNIEKRIDETQLLQSYKKYIKELNHDILNNPSDKLKFDYVINLNDTKEFKFDIAWKNETLNLVKPISFDVKRHETLINKAYRFYGQFLDLDEYAINHSYKFDLLLARPKSKSLFRYYDDAIKLLEKPKSVEIIEDDDLQKYSSKTFNAISNP